MAAGLWVVVLCSLFLASCQATNYTWQNTAGGSWSDSSNWDPAGVPGAADTAIFNYSPCQGIDDDGNADCPVDLGSSPVSIAGLFITDTGGKLALTGTLTVTAYTHLESFSFYNLELTTQGYTEYSTAGDAHDLLGTTWTLQGTTVVNTLNWGVTTTSIINQGTFTITTDSEYETNDVVSGGGPDYTKSVFTNNGIMNWNTYMEYDDTVATFTGSFVNNGNFTNTGGYLQFVSTSSPTYRGSTKWAGSLSSVAGSTTEFYLGLHNFSSTLNLNIQGTLSFYGSSDVWDSSYGCGTATFAGAVTIKSLEMQMCFTVNFMAHTYITVLDISGGTIAGTSNSIVIGNLTGGSVSASEPGRVPLFNSKYITIIDGHDLTGVFSVHDGALVQINGTLSCKIHMDWYGQYLIDENDFSAGGILQVNPQGRLVLHASDDIYVYAHYFYIPVYIYGRVDAVKAQDVDATFSETSIGVFQGGGIIAGPCSAILGYVDDQTEYGYGDLEFYGDWTIKSGANFSGAGIFFFDGPSSATIVFDIPATFGVYMAFGYMATFQFNYDVTFSSTMTWSGGAIYSNKGATLTFPKGSNNIWYGNQNYNLVLDGVTLVNNGVVTYAGGDSFKSVNSATLVNNGNFTTSRYTFSSDGDELIFENNGWLIYPGGNSDGTHLKLVNNGTLYSEIESTVNPNSNFGYDHSDVYLLSSGTTSINIYGRSMAYGDSDVPYDVTFFTAANSCRLGGTLKINFVILPKQVGSSDQFTPTVGDVYSVFAMYQSADNANVGLCVCQFDNVVTTGLDTSKFSVGVLYDKTDPSGTYAGTLLINVVVCAAGDSTCATNKRVGATCPSFSGVTSAAGSSSTTSSNNNGSSAGSVVVSVFMLFIVVCASML